MVLWGLVGRIFKERREPSISSIRPGTEIPAHPQSFLADLESTAISQPGLPPSVVVRTIGGGNHVHIPDLLGRRVGVPLI